MSMLDAFLNKGFKGAKCKTLLKLTIPRIKLLRNRREIQLKQMRRDIAKLLENGQEATARIRVEHIMREENMMAAQEIIELFCELIAVRLPIIETQRECPLDLKEAISSICFAAPRCSDLPELQQIQMLFAAKYGREFVAAAAELMPDCGVNRQIIELLSVRAPSVEAKLKLLKEIAEEHELDWDPAEAEAELHKPHEDLLNGPNHLLGGSTLPLLKEKHDDSSSSNLVEDSYEECGFIADFDSLDLPQVPKISVQPSPNTPSIPEITSPQLPSHPVDSSLVHVDSKSTPLVQDLHVPSSEHDGDSPKPSHSATSYAPPNVLTDTRENKQFIPFVSSPSLPPTSYSLNQEEPASFSCSSVSQNQSKPSPSVSCAKSGANVDLRDVLAAAQAAAETNQSKPSPSVSRAKSGANVDLQDVLAATETNQSKPSPSESCARSEVNVDLQDVLDAAQAAAETAERAAAAARAAASLAKVRITELTAKKNNQTSESTEKEFHENGVNQSKVLEGPIEQENASSHAGHGLAKEHSGGLDSPMLSPDSKQQGPVHQPTHQTQRSTSLEDDPYFSYPNLFTSQVSSPKAS